MARCGDCIHYKICEHYVSQNESFPEVGGCKCFKRKDLYQMLPDGRLELIPTSDNIKSKIVEDILSDLKKEIHKKAIYPGTKEVPPYISLREFDAIITNMSNALFEEGKR